MHSNNDPSPLFKFLISQSFEYTLEKVVTFLN